jgi:hypothetical protein
MQNKFWWGFEEYGTIHCLRYTPGSDDYKMIGIIEKKKHYIIYPFRMEFQDDAFRDIKKRLKRVME